MKTQIYATPVVKRLKKAFSCLFHKVLFAFPLYRTKHFEIQVKIFKAHQIYHVSFSIKYMFRCL